MDVSSPVASSTLRLFSLFSPLGPICRSSKRPATGKVFLEFGQTWRPHPFARAEEANTPARVAEAQKNRSRVTAL